MHKTSKLFFCVILVALVAFSFISSSQPASQPDEKPRTKYVEAPLFYGALFCPKKAPLKSAGYCAFIVMPFFLNSSILVYAEAYNTTESCKCPGARKYIFKGILFKGRAEGNKLFFIPFRIDDNATFVKVSVVASARIGNYNISYAKGYYKEIYISKGPNATVALLPRHVDSLGHESVWGNLIICTNVSLVAQGYLLSKSGSHVSIDWMDMQICGAGQINAFRFGAEITCLSETVTGEFEFRKYGTIEKLNYTITPMTVTVYTIKKYGLEIKKNKIKIYAVLDGAPDMRVYDEEGIRGILIYEDIKGVENLTKITLTPSHGKWETVVVLPNIVGRACAFVAFPSFNKTLLVTLCGYNERLGTAEVKISPNPIFKWKGIPITKQDMYLTIRVRGGLPETIYLNNNSIFRLDPIAVLKIQSQKQRPLLPEELAKKAGIPEEITVDDVKFKLLTAEVTFGETVILYRGKFTRDLKPTELPRNITFSVTSKLWTVKGPVYVSASTTLRVLNYTIPEPNELKSLSITFTLVGFGLVMLGMTLRNFVLIFNRRVVVDWYGLARSLAYIVLAVTLFEFLDSLAAPLKFNYITTIYSLDDRMRFMIELYNGLYYLILVTLATGTGIRVGAKVLLMTGQGRAVGLVLQGADTVGATFMGAGKVLAAFLYKLGEFLASTLAILYGLRMFFTLFYMSAYIIVALLILAPGLMALPPTRGLGAYIVGVLGVLWVGLPPLLGFTNYVLLKFGLDTATLRQITSICYLTLGTNPFLAFRQMGWSTLATLGWLAGWSGGFGQTALMYIDLMVKASVIPIALYAFDIAVLLSFGVALAKWISGTEELSSIIAASLFRILRPL